MSHASKTTAIISVIYKVVRNKGEAVVTIQTNGTVTMFPISRAKNILFGAFLNKTKNNTTISSNIIVIIRLDTIEARKPEVASASVKDSDEEDESHDGKEFSAGIVTTPPVFVKLIS